MPAELDADGVTLRCVTPDLSDLVCDGSVLVEACVCETASDMQWTRRARSSSSRPSTSLASASLASPQRRRSPPSPRLPCVSRLVTFDGRGRRTSGAVESYSAALRQPGSSLFPRGRGGRRCGGGDVGDAGRRAATSTARTTRDRVRARGSVLCVLLEGNIVLERPVAPAPTDAPSCGSDHRADGARQLGLRAGEELVFSVAPRDQRQRERRRADGGGENVPAGRSAAKRKEEEEKAAPARPMPTTTTAAADALATTAARAKATGGRRRADGGGSGGARRRAEGGTTARCTSSSRATSPARPPQTGRRAAGLVKATRLRVLPATIDVPELHGRDAPVPLRRLRQRRAWYATCRDAFGNRVPRVELTIGTELAKLTSVDADGAAIEAPPRHRRHHRRRRRRVPALRRARPWLLRAYGALADADSAIDVLGGDEPDQAISRRNPWSK